MNNEKLLAFANKRNNLEQKATVINASDNEQSDQWLKDWLAKYNIPMTKPEKVDQNGTKYLYVPCPNDDSHKDAAIIVNPDGALGFKCFHDSCSTMTWKNYRLMFEPDAYSKPSESDDSIEKERKQSQSDLLVQFLNDIELFHDELMFFAIEKCNKMQCKSVTPFLAI